MELLKQYAALPYVDGPDGPLVLLVSSRETGRWVIPKGWPKSQLTAAELAALEAFEEAGVAGETGDSPIGSYRYIKKLHFWAWNRCEVDVYPMKVTQQFLKWPERKSRRQVWVAPERAARMVGERGLKRILVDLRARVLQQPA